MSVSATPSKLFWTSAGHDTHPSRFARDSDENVATWSPNWNQSGDRPMNNSAKTGNNCRTRVIGIGCTVRRRGAATASFIQLHLCGIRRKTPVRLLQERQSDPRRTGRCIDDTGGRCGCRSYLIRHGRVDTGNAIAEAGRMLIAPHDCYGGTYRLFESLSAKGHFKVAFVDQTDATALQHAFARQPKLILIETPSNPLLRIVDIQAVVASARACGALR